MTPRHSDGAALASVTGREVTSPDLSATRMAWSLAVNAIPVQRFGTNLEAAHRNVGGWVAVW